VTTAGPTFARAFHSCETDILRCELRVNMVAKRTLIFDIKV